MSKPIAPDYGTTFLLPPSLEDWVPNNHPARFIREFVEQLDMASLKFAMPQSRTGRPPYAPSLLLKIWLYGYMHKIRTTRQLEVACCNELPLVWLCGMIRPDHNSLWRFWRDNKKALRGLFKQSVRIAAKGGLIGLCLQAIDGTKIPAVASGRSGWTKEYMEKLLAQLDEELAKQEQEIEKAGETPRGHGYKLPESLEEKEKLKEMVQKGLEELKKTQCSSYHPHEPETKRMKNNDGSVPFSYNGQAVVDSQEGIITAADVTNGGADQGQLVPMIQQAQENTGEKTERTVGDSGYGKGEDLQAAKEAGFEVLSPVYEGSGKAKDNPYHAHHFQYDPQSGTVTCPEGKTLDFVSEGTRRGQKVKNYRCRIKNCPVRDQCTKDRKGRAIEIWQSREVVQEMRKKLEDPEMKEILGMRGRLAELTFAIIKQQHGFRRWTFRGLEGVQTQWAMVCLTVNLKSFYRKWCDRETAAA